MDATQFSGQPRALISARDLLHNLKIIRRAIPPQTRICAVIKADAYGHVASLVMQALHATSDSPATPLVDALAVASIDEAIALPPTDLPVLIFRSVENAYLAQQRDRLEETIRRGCILTLSSASSAQDLARIAMALGQRASVQIMIDTGITRGGVHLPDLGHVLNTVLSQPSLKLTGLCSHFACADTPDDPFSKVQLTRFLAALASDAVGDLLRAQTMIHHIANSAAIFFFPQSHLNMVRPGISLYGIDPTGRPCIDRHLRPVMKWTAPLIDVREIAKGVGVGYGQTWLADKPTRIGLVPVGYADGYLRCFSNRATMLVHDKPTPVVGRVSMDLTTIDLSNASQAQVGDEVTILDNDPLSPASAYELAKLADTIPYEILCGVGARVRRVLTDPVPDHVDGDEKQEPNSCA
jgi:alanine racemase